VNSQCDKSKEFKNIIPIWQIDFSELTLKEKLGFGAFGEVRLIVLISVSNFSGNFIFFFQILGTKGNISRY
jgi:hypothetical protein